MSLLLFTNLQTSSEKEPPHCCHTHVYQIERGALVFRHSLGAVFLHQHLMVDFDFSRAQSSKNIADAADILLIRWHCGRWLST